MMIFRVESTAPTHSAFFDDCRVAAAACNKSLGDAGDICEAAAIEEIKRCDTAYQRFLKAVGQDFDE